MIIIFFLFWKGNKTQNTLYITGKPGTVGIIFGIIIGLSVALACLYLILKAYNKKKVKVELDKGATDEKDADVEQTMVNTRQVVQTPSVKIR